VVRGETHFLQKLQAFEVRGCRSLRFLGRGGEAGLASDMMVADMTTPPEAQHGRGPELDFNA